MLCRACFLSGAPLGYRLLCSEFYYTTDGDTIETDTELIYMAQKKRQTALCVRICKTLQGIRERLWVCHLWICSTKLIIGPTSSSRWTENLKPTESWATVWREREDIYKHVMGEIGQLKRDERENKMHLYNKDHIMFKLSSSNVDRRSSLCVWTKSRLHT